MLLTVSIGLVPTALSHDSIAPPSDLGDRDRQLLSLRLRQFHGEGEPAELRARIHALDPVLAEAPHLADRTDEIARELSDLGRVCARRKLYLNAVDLLERCRGTALASRAQKELARLHANEAAAAALTRVGRSVPPPPRREREVARLAQRDARHADWERAYVKKTAHYVVRTDIGYEVLQDAAVAMEQMNRFYRRVFRPRGNLKLLEIRMYRSREEFDRFETHHGGNSTVRGYYVPDEYYVAVYDPTTGPDPRPFEALWTTLFHEASHQFTDEVTEGLLPTWLNEGTAAYFEGARLLPDRTIRINEIPERRLRDLQAILERGYPTLREVVRFQRPGSYPASYYPMGWGLVYFLHNFEDEHCEQVYRSHYQAFLSSYAQEQDGGAYERFVESFVEAPALPGVRNFREFEWRFIRWIEDLAESVFGPPEQVTVWMERARSQAHHGKIRAAIQSYDHALQKSPNHLCALVEQATVLVADKQRDRAIWNLRRALERAGELGPEGPASLGEGQTVSELGAEAAQRLRRLDGALAERLENTRQKAVGVAREAVDRYRGAGLPLQALWFLESTQRWVGPQRALLQLGEDICQQEAIEAIEAIPGVQGR